jgi:Predicted sugar nucleotidyltransferases
MKTILLAAGVGQRLGEISGNKPKCLLEFEGISLLRRHLRIFEHYGITEIIIVTGYRSELITREVTRSGTAAGIRYAHNPDYEKGSLISMQTGLSSLHTDEDFILMDADVLYDHRIIARLINTPHHNCFLLDRDYEPGEEPVKICVRDGRLIEFRKKINGELKFDMQGESVGFFRFTQTTAKHLMLAVERYLSRNEVNHPYEECIRDLLLDNPDGFGYEDITGLNWIEIDFPEDIIKARTKILPNILQLV